MNLEMLLQGLYSNLSPENLFACALGVLLGTITGILPGIGPFGAIALLLPFSFGMNTLPTLILFAGIYCGAMYSGAITSILLNIPGEDATVVTCIEGYPLARKGRGGAAIAIAAIGSFIAGTLGVVGVSLFAPVLAKLSLKFGPFEYFAISILALIVLTNLIGHSVLKSSLMAVVGIMLGTVGMDGLTGITRFTLQMGGLQSGLNFTLVVMGLFGMSEIFYVMSEHSHVCNSKKINFAKQYPDREELRRSIAPICRGGIIGFCTGLLPGPATVLSSFLSYAAEKKCHKQPEKFGQGMIEGVAGPEAANNAAATSTLIPLLVLGLPFSPTSALLLSGFTLHGITPGPTLLTQHADIFWGLVASLYVSNFMLLVLNLPLVGIFTFLLRVPVKILMPIVMLLMLTSVYALTQSFFDLTILILFGVFGYLLKQGDYEPAALVIGFILGPQIEWGLVQGLLIGDGQFAAFILRPLSGTILLLAVSLLLYNAIRGAGKIKKGRGIMMFKKTGVLLGALTLLFTTFGCASMQEKQVDVTLTYPAKSLNLIVATTAGGGNDMLGRAIARLSGKHLGQNMLVLNKPGGGYTTGYNELAGSQPDGYTLGIVNPSLIMQPLYGQTQYDYPTALEPIASLTSAPWVLVVRADAPWQNLQELIEDAKQHPGKFKFGHTGLGSVSDVVGEMFAKAADVQIEQVPFQGTAEVITALLGGHVQMFFGGPAEVAEQVRGGNVRVLAVAGTKRLNRPGFMNVPTFREQGVDVIYQNWLGVAVPKGLSPQVKNKLATGIKEIIADPEFNKNLGMNIEYLGPEESAKLWQDERERLSKLIKATGLAERIASQKK